MLGPHWSSSGIPEPALRDSPMIDDPLNRLAVKRGSDLPWAKLDEDAVTEIRRLIRQREAYRAMARALSNAAIAERFGVHRRTIENISAGHGWAHVNEDAA